MTVALCIRVTEPGWGTTVQDLGRVGLAHLGVPRAGAVDRAAHDRANRLVGNEVGAATFETRGGLVIEALRPLVAATSADGQRHTLSTGDRLRVEAHAQAGWTYVAVRGGIDVAPVLGSRSHDTLAGLGPPPIVAGSAFTVGPDPGGELVADHAPARPPERVVRLWEGPRTDWFVDGLDALTARRWIVGNDISRVGARLEPGRFERTPHAAEQMASEGLVAGAIQITPRGEPIVMLANHPTTGGYPVIAVVDPDDLQIVAEAIPGASVRFVAARIHRSR